MPPSEPEDLKRLGERIDAAGKKLGAENESRAAPSPMGIAFRLGTELVAAVFVGGAMGLGIDWAAEHWASVHTRPAGLIVMFILGAATGIRSVIRTSRQISADTAPKE